jgi:predicted ATPase
LAEYERLLRTYPVLGYDVTVLPKISISERANLVLRALEREG